MLPAARDVINRAELRNPDPERGQVRSAALTWFFPTDCSRMPLQKDEVKELPGKETPVGSNIIVALASLVNCTPVFFRVLGRGRAEHV